jgi:hypothetical protein
MSAGALHRFDRWMYRGGRPNRLARLLNRTFAMVASAGLLPDRMATLEVTGRRTGRTFSFPAVVADYEGERYLVSMLGEGELGPQRPCGRWSRGVAARSPCGCPAGGGRFRCAGAGSAAVSGVGSWRSRARPGGPTGSTPGLRADSRPDPGVPDHSGLMSQALCRSGMSFHA